jgi:hypothetical protein
MNRTSFKRAFLAALAVSFLGLLPAVAHADPSEGDMAQARALLHEGLVLRSKGDASAAIEKLKAAHALARTPITAFELGNTYLAAGKLVEAREAFLSVARIPVRVEETDRSRTARSSSQTQADQLRSRIPNILIKVTGVPPESVTVTLDGGEIPAEALGAPRFVNPGSHVVSARSTAGATAETTVTLVEGDARNVELNIVPKDRKVPETAAAPAPAGPLSSPEPNGVFRGTESTPRTESQSHLAQWSLIGAGVAIGVAGGVLMAVEAGQASNGINQLNRSEYDSAKGLYIVGIAGVALGALTAASGGVWLIVSSQSRQGETAASLWMGAAPDGLKVGGGW